jgi:hypothetical protein
MKLNEPYIPLAIIFSFLSGIYMGAAIMTFNIIAWIFGLPLMFFTFYLISRIYSTK